MTILHLAYFWAVGLPPAQSRDSSRDGTLVQQEELPVLALPKGTRGESELAESKRRQGTRSKKFLLLGVKPSCRAAQRTVTEVPQGALLWMGQGRQNLLRC